jgi:Ran GTPase-activating protein (RanGAP) involved in mRNA processing and transport
LPPTLPGLIKLHTLKAGFTKITDGGLQNVLKACPNLVHLELNRCDLSEFGVRFFVKEVPQLKFLDLSSVSGISLALLEEIKCKKPDLNLR